jgi:RimJ/RimL family protein N-acetyltransferase
MVEEPANHQPDDCVPGITMRPVQESDRDFLFALYAAVRAPEFALLPLPEEQKRHLLNMQFEAQQGAYRAQYPGSTYNLILHDGEPVGRLWLADLPNEIRLVDISLLPEASGSGIGSCLLRRLQAEAAAAAKPIRSSVFRFNAGSLRWHQRLGFRVVAEDEVQLSMEWGAPQGAANAPTSAPDASV